MLWKVLLLPALCPVGRGIWTLVTTGVRRVAGELPSWAVLGGREPGGIL